MDPRTEQQRAQEAKRPAAPVGRLRVNGKQVAYSLDPRSTVLDVLREQLGLTGTKKGCDHGQCGACTILANGQRVLACMSLAIAHQDDDLTTIEGLATGDQLHEIQEAFIEHDALQCGYCTPGQIMSAVALLEEARGCELTDDELRDRMSGNLCRCGAYPNILAAIKQVRRAPRRGPS